MAEQFKWNDKVREYVNSSGDECTARAVVSLSDYRAVEQALADLNIENLIRVAKEAEERGEQRIPCFLQVEWVARAAKALGFTSDRAGVK